MKKTPLVTGFKTSLAFIFGVVSISSTGFAAPKLTKKSSHWAVAFQLPIHITPNREVILTYNKGRFLVSGVDGNKPQMLLEGLDELDVLNKQVVVTVGDMNFDGFSDIAIDQSYGYGGANITTYIHFWLPQQKRFQTDGFGVMNFELDAANKTLMSPQRNGPKMFCYEYKFNDGTPWKFHTASQSGNTITHKYFDQKGNKQGKARPRSAEGINPTNPCQQK